MILWFLWFANTRDAPGAEGSSGATVLPRGHGRGRVREYELYILPAIVSPVSVIYHAHEDYGVTGREIVKNGCTEGSVCL